MAIYKRFRKRPIVVEAVQWNGRNKSEISDFTKNKLEDYGGIKDGCFKVYTPEGLMIVRKGDWVVKGIKGEYYPVKSDIFDKTYVEVVDKTPYR